ncbi:MAG: Flavodoxin reductases (ferredoxin-NADPH reductases) family 1, partial [uncultured Acetobacteraceae bacterium]
DEPLPRDRLHPSRPALAGARRQPRGLRGRRGAGRRERPSHRARTAVHRRARRLLLGHRVRNRLALRAVPRRPAGLRAGAGRGNARLGGFPRQPAVRVRRQRFGRRRPRGADPDGLPQPAPAQAVRAPVLHGRGRRAGSRRPPPRPRLPRQGGPRGGAAVGGVRLELPAAHPAAVHRGRAGRRAGAAAVAHGGAGRGEPGAEAAVGRRL